MGSRSKQTTKMKSEAVGRAVRDWLGFMLEARQGDPEAAPLHRPTSTAGGMLSTLHTLPVFLVVGYDAGRAAVVDYG